MDEISHKVINLDGKEVGSVSLMSDVFASPANTSVVHQIVKWQLAKRRAGTHKAKTRSEVKASNAKPYKQKGTGRARAGSKASPVWVGGGKAHGPRPHSYESRINKAQKRLAMCSVLSDKVANEKLIVIDHFASESGKTSAMAKSLNNIGINGSAIVVADNKSLSVDGVSDTDKAMRAIRNIPRTSCLPSVGLNVFDLLRHDYVVVTKTAVEELQDRLSKSQQGGK